MKVELDTAIGRLQGLRDPAGVNVYRGIPYAQAPTGPWRFKSPRPASAWSGVLDATAPGPSSVQSGSSMFSGVLPGNRVERVDEDCLTLDIWAPAAGSEAGRPVIVLRSFSKTFGLAGLRLGYALADPSVARLLDIVQEPFNVNRVALAAGRVAVGMRDFVERRRAEVASAREVLRDQLGHHGIATHPSQANFVLVELGVDDRPVCDALLAEGVLIRGGHEFGLPGFARVTVAPEPVMRRTAALIAAALGR